MPLFHERNVAVYFVQFLCKFVRSVLSVLTGLEVYVLSWCYLYFDFSFWYCACGQDAIGYLLLSIKEYILRAVYNKSNLYIFANGIIYTIRSCVFLPFVQLHLGLLALQYYGQGSATRKFVEQKIVILIQFTMIISLRHVQLLVTNKLKTTASY